MNFVQLQRVWRPLRALALLPFGLLAALLISVMVIADGPIASSSFVGAENPLSENGLWTPVTAYSPYGTRFQKNNGALADRLSPLNHAASHTTAVVPADHYSEIVVGHIGTTSNNVGPIARVQASGPMVPTTFIAWTPISRIPAVEPPTPLRTSRQLPQSLTVTDFASSREVRSSTDSKTACATSFITPAPTRPNTPPARLE